MSGTSARRRRRCSPSSSTTDSTDQTSSSRPTRSTSEAKPDPRRVAAATTLQSAMREPVGILDGLVRRVLSTYPFRFTVAADEADELIACRIRAEVVTEAGWSSSPYPDGVERDEFDAAAVHLIGWDDTEP